VFVAAAALVGDGGLSAVGVVVCGTLGAALGDQVAYYLLRHRVRFLVDHAAIVRRAAQAVSPLVRRRPAWLPLAIRFAPGLRIAIAAACAYAEVPPWLFSTCTLVSALLWATGIVAAVAWLGPTWLPRAGMSNGWALAVPAVLVVIAFGLGARALRAATSGHCGADRERSTP
jgi:membrane protein DedA with SNARE-associated domain